MEKLYETITNRVFQTEDIKFTPKDKTLFLCGKVSNKIGDKSVNAAVKNLYNVLGLMKN